MTIRIPRASGARPILTRRSFLRASAGVGIVGAGLVSLSACSSDQDDPSGEPEPLPTELADATLLVSDAGPYKAVPDEAAQADDPSNKIYADTLQAWLDENPAVKLEAANVDVWNKDAMVTAIAGGTAPAIYYANVIGSWNNEGIKQAFAQQLAADTTDLVASFDVVGRMTDTARMVWERNWGVDGRYYGAPLTFSIGEVVHYRRDLVDQLGLPQPELGWTWADLRALALALNADGRKGIMLRTSPMNYAFKTAEGAEVLGRLPNPDGPWWWRYDYGLQAEAHAEAVANIRGMIFEDESALADIGTGDDPWAPRHAFNRGEIAMHINSIDMLLQGPDAEDGPVALADRAGLPLDDVTGIVALPAGLNGNAGPSSCENILQAVSFDPELGKDELTAAFSLHMYMNTDGQVSRGKAQFDAAQDLRSVWQGARAYPVFTEVIEGLPGSLAEGWGEKIAASVGEIAELAQRPDPLWFIPVETNPGPGDEALNDAMTKWWYEPSEPDVAGDLDNLSSVRNDQAASFSSSVPWDDFAAGASEYYDALATHWEENAPEFHRDTFEPWLEEHVRPALG
ncbi:extracellular solute-binding protein [Jiangella endophytica]|uniref:extracellular solute-binding protein n=1 Tax=Jiangella endophytica TaxID=1623398 RepID=UPI000E3579D8|nr:extracellular solute-binding protein [Jiangella endophytica]